MNAVMSPPDDRPGEPEEAASGVRPLAAFREPYRSTPVFDQDTLPDALRRDHRTRPGTWGVIRVLSGAMRLHRTESGGVEDLTEGSAGVVQPGETHWVEPLGTFRMQVDFYDAPPGPAGRGA